MTCPHCGADNDHASLSCAVCGRALGVLAPGQVLSARFEVISRIGAGGMGVVYKAHDRELDEVVALKVLRSDLAHSEEMARRFRSEIKLARRVRNPHVCGIHEYGQDGPLRFIVMEFVEGVDLKRVLGEGPLAHEKAFEVAVQVAGALEAIHDAGILHRDLKPANVMLDGQGRVHLMDFGIAKQFGQSSNTGLTATGMIVGTPEYMSPEQVRGETLDVRSDVYSLGVVLFELFTGRVPFRGHTALATLYEHVHSPVPVEEARAAGAPPAVIAILERALAKSAGERFGTAAELETALRDARSAPRPPVEHEATAPVRGSLALKPEPALHPEPSQASTFQASGATEVDTPAAVLPAEPRRPYAGRPPHLRSSAAAQSPARGGRPWGAIALVAGAVAAGVAAAWMYGPQLRGILGLARPPEASRPVEMTPATLAPSPAAPRVVPASAAPAPLEVLPAPLEVVPAPESIQPSPAASAAPSRPFAPSRSPASDRPPSAAPTQAAPTRPEPAAGSIERAEELFASGRFGAALAEARTVLARDPGNQEAQQLIEDTEVELLVERRLKEARGALAAGNRDLALQSVELGLAAKPTDSRLVALRRQLKGE